MSTIADLIPLPVKVDPNGVPYPEPYAWHWPASPEYAAAVTLPAGWELYQTLAQSGAPDAETQAEWIRLAGKDYGASRGGGADVFGVRNADGTPRHLRALAVGGRDRIFAADELAAACAWCDEKDGHAT